MYKWLSVLLLGCGLPVSPLDAGVLLPDAATDAGAPSSDAGTHSGDAGGSFALQWLTSSVSLPSPRDHHASVLVDSALYVTGGTNAWQTLTDEVVRFEIRADGSLEPAVVVSRMPQVRAGHTVVALGGRLVVTGGLTEVPLGRYALQTSISAPLLADGGVGNWREETSLPMPVMHHSCDVLAERMYCFGGRIAGNFTGELAVSTAFDPASGALMGFTQASPLPHSLGFHQSFAFEGALYVLGGLQRDAPMQQFLRPTEVLRAELTASGVLGPWVNAGALPISIHVGAAQVFEGRVLVVGGINDADGAIREVYAAPLEAPLRFSTVSNAPSLPRMHVHQLPRRGRWFYLIGGRLENGESSALIEVGAVQ